MNLGLRAKQTLSDYVPVIDAKLAAYFNSELSLHFGFNERQKVMVAELLTHSKEHNLRPAKRLRGSLVNYGFALSGKEFTSEVWNAAMAVEIVHTGLLMHDDFMDGDAVRRGGPTTHKYYESKAKVSEHTAAGITVCAGDALSALGYELLSRCGNAKALQKMLRGIVNTAYGQAYDLILESLGQWSEDDVITLHKAKSAIYTYENPLLIGAYLGGISDPVVLKLLSEYAMAGGVAFQLQDDLLGVFGTPEKTGKSADSDLLQGKCTLLIHTLLQRGTKSQKATLKPVWGRRVATKAQIAALKRAIIASGSYDYSCQRARDFAILAAKSAYQLRKIKGLNPLAIDYIEGIAHYMVDRTT